MQDHGPQSWLLSLPALPKDESLIHINGAVVVTLFITAVSLFAYRAIKKAGANGTDALIVPSPKPSLLNIVDVFIEGLKGLVVGTIGHGGEKYFPFIATLFIFILFSNLLSLLPFGSAPTSNINTTLALGIATFVYYNIMGIREHGLVGYLKHFLMGLGPAGVLVALLEIVSHSIRPLSLGIRLFVNMFVDHTIMTSFASLCAWIVPVPLLLFGIVVSTIQAFVFATLTAVYVQMATEHEH